MHTHPTSTDEPASKPVQIDPNQCATLSLTDAARVLGVHRSTAWELYRRDEFPVPVLKIGSRLRVARVHLEAFLGGDRGRQ